MDSKQIYVNLISNLTSIFNYYSNKELLIPQPFLNEHDLKLVFEGFLHAFDSYPTQVIEENSKESIQETKNDPPAKSIRHAHLMPSAKKELKPYEEEPLIILSLISSLLHHKLSDDKILVRCSYQTLTHILGDSLANYTPWLCTILGEHKFSDIKSADQMIKALLSLPDFIKPIKIHRWLQQNIAFLQPRSDFLKVLVS